MANLLDQILTAARRVGASDIHLKVGLRPIFRIRGELRTIRDVPLLEEAHLIDFMDRAMSSAQKEEYRTYHECDMSYSSPESVRFRINAFRQRGLPGLVLRVIPAEVPSFETLMLPEVVAEIATGARGLVLVTGVTGSGKSTTLAAMVDHINTTQASHIVTIEDPVEFLFSDKRSVINQRELGLDTTSFSRALRAALRQDPDVVLVGEMRDLETIETALLAAETGHLVLSTLHTTDSVETVNRIIGAFPKDQQGQIRMQLSAALKAVVSQRLLPQADGNKMAPAVEVLVNTARVRELIENGERTHEIRQAIADGRDPYGMMTFDQSLTQLVKRKLVTYEVALRNATNPDDFALEFRGIASSHSSSHEWLE